MNLIDILKKVTYKPDCELRIKVIDHRVTLTISRSVPDSMTPGATIHICMSMEFDREEKIDLSDIYRRVQALVYNFETHEIDEWLKIAGKCLNNPHPF